MLVLRVRCHRGYRAEYELAVKIVTRRTVQISSTETLVRDRTCTVLLRCVGVNDELMRRSSLELAVMGGEEDAGYPTPITLGSLDPSHPDTYAAYVLPRQYTYRS